MYFRNVLRATGIPTVDHAYRHTNIPCLYIASGRSVQALNTYNLPTVRYFAYYGTHYIVIVN